MTEANPPAEKPIPSDVPVVVRKRRRWPKILGIIVVLLIALVVLLPTIVSTAPVRSLVLSQASGFVDGKVEVQSWSLGWFSPLSISGVKVYDNKSVLVLEADKVETEATLLRLIRGSFDFGKTTVSANATKVVIYPDGLTNLHDVFKLRQSQSAAQAEPAPASSDKSTKLSKIPDVRVDLELNLRGAVEVVDASGKVLSILQLRQGSGGTVKIDDINQAVRPDLKFIYDVDGRPASTVAINGSVDAIQNNQVDVANLAAQLKVVLTTVDIGAVRPALAMAGLNEIDVDGIATGEINADIKPGQAGGAKGEVQVAKARLAMPQMPDVYQAELIRVPIDVSRLLVDGKSRLKIDIKAILPEATLSAAGDLPEDGLINLSQKKLPGDVGVLNIALVASPEKLARALPKTMRLLPDVQITGGDVNSNIDINLKPDRIDTDTKSVLSLQGTRAGKAQTIAPLTITTAASVLDIAQLATGIRDLSATFTSEFANMQLGGARLTDINGDGSADLDKLRSQLAQFIDLSNTNLAGQAKFNLRNVVKEGSTTDYMLSLGATLTGINIKLGQSPAIDMPYVKADLGSDYVVDLNASNPLKQIKTATGSLAMGSASDKLVLDGHVKLDDIDLTNLKVGRFEIPQSTINDLNALQKMIDPFVPQLRAQGIQLVAGQVYFGATGSADLNTKTVVLTQLDASTPGLRVSKSGKELVRDKFVLVASGTLSAGSPQDAPKVGGETMRVELANLSINSAMLKLSKTKTPLIVSMINGMPRGAGDINIEVNLPAVSRTMQALSAEPVNAISSGALKGELSLATDSDMKSTVRFDGDISALSIDQTPVQNQAVTAALNVAASPAMDHMWATMDLKSAYATVIGKDISVNLKTGVPVLKMVEKASFDVGMKDFPNAYALATALVPSIKLPYTPTSGGVGVIANVNGSSVNLEITASRLALRNAAGKEYAFDRAKPVSIIAALDVKGDQKMDSITFSKLNADVGAAVVLMTEPIVVTELASTPAVKGQLQINGSLDRVTPLLQFVQQAEKPLPYRGEFAFNNTLSNAGNTTTAILDGTVNDFVLLDQATNKPAFTEKQIKVTGDLSADIKSQVAQIKSLNIDMSSSQAAKIAVTGGVKQFLTSALYFDNIAAKIDAQGEKAWPMIFPLLPPENQATLASAKITGPINFDLRADGPYDTAKPLHEAVKKLTVKGDIQLAGADLSESYGVTLANYRQFITLREGMLVTGNLDKPRGDPSRFAPAFDINGGKGDFNSISINIGDPGMLVTVGKKQKILSGVQMNRVMAAQLGSLASVMFKDAKEASGIVDVIVQDCTNVPLADLMAGSKKAKAMILYSVRDLKLDGPVPNTLASTLGWGDKGIIGNIENGSLTLNNGVAYQDMTLSITKNVEQTDERTGKNRMVDVLENMQFKGGIDLEKQKFRDYSMWISQGLLPRKWQKDNPRGATVGLRGDITDINSILGQALLQLGIQGYGQDIIGDLLNQGGNKRDK